MLKNKSKNILIICLSICFLNTACQKDKLSKEKKQDHLILAEVNGEKISLEEFNKKFKYIFNPPFAVTDKVEKNMKILKKQFLGQYIENKLILQEAKKHNITITAITLNEAINKIVKNYSDGNFEQVLAEDEISYQDWLDNLKEGLLIKETIATIIYDNINITDEEIKNYYEKHADEFEQLEQVKVKQIVVETEKEARDILTELRRRPKNFEKLAKEKSLSPDGKIGGDIGFFARGQMPPEFDEVAFSLRKGQISDVIRTDYGFHIFTLVDKKKARKLSLPEVYDKIREELILNKQSNQIQKWLKEIKKKAKIKINPHVLNLS